MMHELEDEKEMPFLITSDRVAEQYAMMHELEEGVKIVAPAMGHVAEPCVMMHELEDHV